MWRTQKEKRQCRGHRQYCTVVRHKTKLVLILALPCSVCETVGKPLTLSMIQLPQL
jgi:hypothetical protein